MGVEVIIPAYRPDERLNLLLDRLNTQTVTPQRVTVVLSTDSDADRDRYSISTDPDVELSFELSVEYISRASFGHGKTRQEYLSGSEAEYVLLMTQDAIPYDDMLIERLLLSVNAPDVAVAYARQLPFSDADPIERFTRIYNYPSKSHVRTASDMDKYGIKAIFSSDTCAMYSRNLHNRIGGFDVNAEFGEDAVFAYNALVKGYKVAYCAEAKVFHSHNYTAGQYFRRSIAIAASQQKHPEIYESLKSESEGMRYFLKGAAYFAKKHKYKNIISLFNVCTVRYAGYFVGKHAFLKNIVLGVFK